MFGRRFRPDPVERHEAKSQYLELARPPTSASSVNSLTSESSLSLNSPSVETMSTKNSSLYGGTNQDTLAPGMCQYEESNFKGRRIMRTLVPTPTNETVVDLQREDMNVTAQSGLGPLAPAPQSFWENDTPARSKLGKLSFSSIKSRMLHHTTSEATLRKQQSESPHGSSLHVDQEIRALQEAFHIAKPKKAKSFSTPPGEVESRTSDLTLRASEHYVPVPPSRKGSLAAPSPQHIRIESPLSRGFPNSESPESEIDDYQEHGRQGPAGPADARCQAPTVRASWVESYDESLDVLREMEMSLRNAQPRNSMRSISNAPKYLNSRGSNYAIPEEPEDWTVEGARKAKGLPSARSMPHMRESISSASTGTSIPQLPKLNISYLAPNLNKVPVAELSPLWSPRTTEERKMANQIAAFPVPVALRSDSIHSGNYLQRSSTRSSASTGFSGRTSRSGSFSSGSSASRRQSSKSSRSHLHPNHRRSRSKTFSGRTGKSFLEWSDSDEEPQCPAMPAPTTGLPPIPKIPDILASDDLSDEIDEQLRELMDFFPSLNLSAQLPTSFMSVSPNTSQEGSQSPASLTFDHTEDDISAEKTPTAPLNWSRSLMDEDLSSRSSQATMVPPSSIRMHESTQSVSSVISGSTDSEIDHTMRRLEGRDGPFNRATRKGSTTSILSFRTAQVVPTDESDKDRTEYTLFEEEEELNLDGIDKFPTVVLPEVRKMPSNSSLGSMSASQPIKPRGRSSSLKQDEKRVDTLAPDMSSSFNQYAAYYGYEGKNQADFLARELDTPSLHAMAFEKEQDSSDRRMLRSPAPSSYLEAESFHQKRFSRESALDPRGGFAF